MTWHYNSDERSIFDDNSLRVCLLPDLRDDSATNGALLAAAPDMLEALERVASWLYCDLIHPDKPLDRDSAGKAYAEIKTAINKARGN